MVKISVGVGVLAIALIVYGISLAVWIATLETGKSQVEDIADLHRAEIARSTRNRIDDQLSAAEKLTHTNALMFSKGAFQHPDRRDPRGNETDHFLAAFRAQLYGSRFITTVSMTDRRGNLFGVYTNFDFTFHGMWEQYANATTGEPTLLDYETYAEGLPNAGEKKELIGTTVPYNCSEEIWYTVVDVNVADSNAWTPMYFMQNEGEVISMLSQSHRAVREDGSLVGVTTIDMATGFVGATLSEVGNSDTLTFAVDTIENALLGTSKVDQILKCSTDTTIPLASCPQADQTFLSPMESTNPDVRTIATMILAKYGYNWQNVPAMQFEQDGFLVSTEVVNKNLLRWVIVVSVPKSSLLDKTNRNTILMIVLQVLCGILQILLSIAFAYAIRKPLSKLIKQMEDLKRFKVSSTEEDADNSSGSLFAEINRLERGHKSLQASMGKVKSFVPQSVLADLAKKDDDEDDDVDDVDDEGTADLYSSTVGGKIRKYSEVSGAESRGSSAVGRKSSHLHKSETGSRTSRRSARSVSSTMSNMIVAVQIHQGVNRRRMSILSMNIRGFNNQTYDRTGDEIATIMERLCTIVYASATAHKGMIDYFQGDHFILNFNAAQNCAAHCAQSALTALEISAKCASLKPAFETTIGIASGICACGNVGSNDVKRFGVIGTAFTQATQLEKLCVQYKGINILCTKNVADDSEGKVLSQHVDCVNLPNRTFISTPRSKQEGDQTEWMYELKNQYQPHNDKFKQFMKTEVGQSAGTAAPYSSPLTPEELLEELIASNVDGSAYARDIKKAAAFF